MKSLKNTSFIYLLIGFLFCYSQQSFGQTSITAIGTAVTQDFNTLSSGNPKLWSNNTTLPGWYVGTDATPSIALCRVTSGSTLTTLAGLYSIGAATDADRAFGYLPSNTFTGSSSENMGYIGWRLKNTTAFTIGSVKLIWSGEQWRKAVDANAQYITVSYKVDKDLTDLFAGYTQTTSTFQSVLNNTENATAIDGNTNSTKGITLNLSVVIPPGSEIMIRWEDKNDPANHVLAIDDVSFTATKQTQIITFADLDNKTFGDNPFELTATASSGLDVVYESSNEDVATISNNIVTLTGAGVTSIVAKQLGNDDYVLADSVVRVLNVKPQTPIATAATSIEVMGFTVNWTLAIGATSYYLYYSIDENFSSFEVASVGNVTSFHLNGLIPSTTYYYKIQSFNTGIYSDDSNVLSVTTGDANQTSNIVATPTFTGVYLDWTSGNLGSRAVFVKVGDSDSAIPEDYYHYYGDVDWDMKTDQIGESGYYNVYYGSDSSVELTNLFPGELYSVKIFEYIGSDWEEQYLTTTGANNPITFSTWNSTTWTNSTGVTTAEDFANTARWDHATVPTAALHSAVKVYIDGNCETTTDVVSKNLTINASHDGITPAMTIKPATSLTVTESLTNNGGASALQIKSNSTQANGSLIYPQGLTVPATVEMYSKAAKSTSYKWQYFGIPVQTVDKSPTFVDGANYVRQYNEPGTSYGFGLDKRWMQLQDGAVLSPFVGYEVTQLLPKTYTFTGNLVSDDYSSGELSYTATAQYPGQHLIGNPYTAAIQISDLEFGTTTASIMENTVYLYNTGSYADWTSAGGGVASNVESDIPGLWISVPKLSAGTNGLPSQIPSMQAFAVNVLQSSSLATLSIPYSSVVSKNSTMLRAPRADKVSTRIDVKGTNFTDKLWLISEPSCSHGYDNGWDGYKLLGSTDAPQLYAQEPDSIYQVNTVDDFDNTSLGFLAGSDTEYTLTFNHQNMTDQYPTLYLIDLNEGITTDVSENGSQYSFVATNTTEPITRFKIVTHKDVSTGMNMAESSLVMYNVGKSICINNLTDKVGELKVCDVSGRVVLAKHFDANNKMRIESNLSKGIYILRAEVGELQKTMTIVIQ